MATSLPWLAKAASVVWPFVYYFGDLVGPHGSSWSLGPAIRSQNQAQPVAPTADNTFSDTNTMPLDTLSSLVGSSLSQQPNTATLGWNFGPLLAFLMIAFIVVGGLITVRSTSMDDIHDFLFREDCQPPASHSDGSKDSDTDSYSADNNKKLREENLRLRKLIKKQRSRSNLKSKKNKKVLRKTKALQRMMAEQNKKFQAQRRKHVQRIGTLIRQKGYLEDENDKLVSALCERDDVIEQHGLALANSTKQVDEKTKTLKDYLARLRNAEIEVSEQASRITELKSANEAEATRVTHLEQEAIFKTSIVTTLSDQLDSKDHENQQLKSKLDDQDRESKQLQVDLATSQARAQDLANSRHTAYQNGYDSALQKCQDRISRAMSSTIATKRANTELVNERNKIKEDAEKQKALDNEQMGYLRGETSSKN